MKLFCVIGLGQFGRQVAVTLSEMGGDVLVLDTDERRLEDVKDLVSRAVRVDATDREALRAVGVEDVDTAVVAVGENFEAGVLVTAHLKHFGVGWIVARASNTVQGEILSLVGADRVIYPEIQMGEQIARGLLSHNILEHLKISEDLNVVEMRAPTQFVGKGLKDLHLRNRFGVNVVSIRRLRPYVDEQGQTQHRVVNEMISPTDPIQRDDVLVVVGSDEGVARLAEVEGD